MEQALLTSFWFLYFVALLGMFSHFLKKNIKGETITAIKDYFKDNLKSTILAFIFTSIAFFGYYVWIKSGTDADILTVFFIGFSFDSLMNKYEAADMGDFIGKNKG